MSARILAASFLALAASSAMAADLKVPSDEFPSIGDAAAAAQDGDRILVSKGTYAEHVTINANNVQIIGKKAKWDGHVGDVEGVCLTITGTGCTVSGFVFVNGLKHVIVSGADVTVRKCTSRGSKGNSFELVSATGARIERCVFLSSGSAAIDGGASHDAAVTRCSIRGSGDEGIQFETTSNRVHVSDCTVTNTEDGEGVRIVGSDAVVTG